MGIFATIGAKLLGDAAIPLVDKVADVVDRFIETPDEKRKFNEILSTAQTEINALEAQHRSIFVAGWRPFIGWVCGFGLAWQFILQHIVSWGVAVSGRAILLPDIPTEGLLPLTMALLGIGGLRTLEKFNGISK